MLVYFGFDVPRSLTGLDFVAKVIKFVYYTTFIKDFDKNIILLLSPFFYSQIHVMFFQCIVI